MKIKEVISFLESLADPSLQENYDNAGLLTGEPGWECTGILCALDCIETVVEEAVARKCNLIVGHHPIVFSGLKRINSSSYVGRTIMHAIKHDVAIYAIHTNLDNVLGGVSGRMADKLGLGGKAILAPKENTLKKIYTYVPIDHAEKVRQAIFDAGAGQIGNYSDCSFNVEGLGSFKAGEGADPFVGQVGQRHYEKETRIEVVFPAYLEKKVVAAMLASHPYEEVAYEVIALSNHHLAIGSGVIGDLPQPMAPDQFLTTLKKTFGVKMIRHTALPNKMISRVAVCGGAGSFLIRKALAASADAYVTADLKYHEFFDAEGRMLLADIGHFESEQFTINLLQEVLEQKFLNFAVLKTGVVTNPVNYFQGETSEGI